MSRLMAMGHYSDSAFWELVRAPLRRELRHRQATEQVRIAQRKRLHLPPPPQYRHKQRY